MADRVEQAMRRVKKRRRVGRIIYLLLVVVAVVVVWRFIPQDVIDAIRSTYLNPDAGASMNP